MTFAFGIHPDFQEVYRTSEAGMRFALLEKNDTTHEKGSGAGRRGGEDPRAARAMPENRFAIGAHFEMNKFDLAWGEDLWAQ